MRRGTTSEAYRRAGRAIRGPAGIVLLLAVAAAAPQPAAAQFNAYNSIGLEWTAPGDDGNVGQVSSYQLRFRTTPVGADTSGWWSGAASSDRITLGAPLAPAGATDSTRVMGLSPGTTYYFIIRALDEAGNISGYSNVATATTLACTPPASTPGQFAAVASTGEVLVSWTPASDPLAVSLHLYRSVGTSGPWSLLRDLPLSATSHTDLSVSPGTTYRYRAAYMGAACEGPMTATEIVTTPGTPGPPPSPGIEPASIRVYPNPATGPVRLVIEVTAPTSQPVYVRLFDLNGQWIATLADGTYPQGTTEIVWSRVARNGGAVGPGFYQILGTVGSTRVSERLVLLP